MFAFLPLFCFAQNGGGIDSGLLSFLGTLAGVAAMVLPITGWIKTLLKLEDSAARWLSWLIAVLLGGFGHFSNVGIFEDVGLLVSLLTGLAAGLIANGVFTIEIVKTILEWIKAQLPKK